MMRRFHSVLFAAITLSLVVLPACGRAPVARPLYVVTHDNGHLYLERLSADAPEIVDRIDLGSVDNTPPASGLAMAANGFVVVTNTASFKGSAIAVQASTLACTFAKGSCSPLTTGGSDTVDRLAGGFAVPVYQGIDINNPKVALISGGSPPQLDRTVDLPSGWVPGAIEASTDGKYLYWLTARVPPSPSIPPDYHLLQYDLGARRIANQVDFGLRVPGDVRVAPNGAVYVAITYNTSGSKNPPSEPSSGSSVEVFTADLAHIGSISVGPEPFHLSSGGSNGGVLALTYRGTSPSKVDLISTQTRSLLRSIPLPTSSTMTFLSTLSNGDFAVVSAPNPVQFSLGIVPSERGSPTWRTYSGEPESPIAG